MFDSGFECHSERDMCPRLICVNFPPNKVHLLNESGYSMPCVNNLTILPAFEYQKYVENRVITYSHDLTAYVTV